MKYSFFLVILIWGIACQNTGKVKQYAELEKRTIYILVHKENPVVKLTSKEIEKIFLGKRGRWDNLITIKRYDYPPIQKAFYEQVLGIPSTEFTRYWNYQKFMAGPPRPVIVKKARDLVSILEKELGGIGYVTTPNIPDSLKVVAQFEVIRE